ncbi:hypothetical protein [Amycolatopsis pithecellobii]
MVGQRTGAPLARDAATATAVLVRHLTMTADGLTGGYRTPPAS